MILPLATDTYRCISNIYQKISNNNKCKPPLATPQGKLQLATR